MLSCSFFWSSSHRALDFTTTDRDRPALHLQSPVLDSVTFIIPFLYFTAILLERSASHSRHPRSFSANMDAQWQQFYWQHYLLQQQQQQQTSGQQTHQYTPTGAYGPLTHAVRTQQAHQHHPYTPSPGTAHQAHPSSPAANQAFPPPPPPPLPTAAPTTPTNTSFKHSPTHPTPPAPPATVPLPPPTVQESWHSTESHWDSHLVHGTSSTGPSSQHYGLAESASPVYPRLRFFPGSLRAMVRLTVQPERLAMESSVASYRRGASPSQFLPPFFFAGNQRPALRPGCHRRNPSHCTRRNHPQQDDPGTGLPRPFDCSYHRATAAEGSALRALKSTVTDDLARARQKLQAHGIELTPRKDAGRSSTTATLPSAPTAPADPAPHQPPALADVLQPPHPSLKDDVPEAWTTPAIQQWMRTFDSAIQDSANEILRILQTNKITTDQLKEAATRYGLPLTRVNKLTIKSLQQIQFQPHSNLLQLLHRLHQALSTLIHYSQYIERAEAIFAVGLPPHSAFLLPILHTTIPTMASTTTTPPGAPPYLSLPPLSLTQLRLRQALFQHPLTTPMLPPTRPLLHRLHQHWRPPSGTQPARQAQTTPEQHTSLR